MGSNYKYKKHQDIVLNPIKGADINGAWFCGTYIRFIVKRGSKKLEKKKKYLTSFLNHPVECGLPDLSPIYHKLKFNQLTCGNASRWFSIILISRAEKYNSLWNYIKIYTWKDKNIFAELSGVWIPMPSFQSWDLKFLRHLRLPL